MENYFFLENYVISEEANSHASLYSNTPGVTWHVLVLLDDGRVIVRRFAVHYSED